MSSWATILHSLVKRLGSTTSLPDRLMLLQTIQRTLCEHEVEPAEEHFIWLREIIDLAERLNRPVSIAEGFALEGDCYARGKDWRKGIKSWGKAIRLFKDLDAKEERVDLLLKSARAARELGLHADTTEFYREGIEVAREAKIYAQEKRGVRELGEFYTSIGDHARALPLFLNLLRLAEEDASPEELGRAQSDVGIAYAEIGESVQGLKYLQSAFRNFREVGAHQLEVMTLVNLSNIYAAEGDVDKGLQCGLQALAIYEVLNDRQGIATILLNLSNISEEIGELEGAADYRLKSLDIFEELEDQHGRAIALSGLGRLYYRAGQLNDARFVLEQTLSLAEEIGDREILCRCHELLAGTLEAIGDTVRGMKHLRCYIDLQRKIDLHEQRRAAAETQARFDLERSESAREILQLKAERLEAEMRKDKAELNALSLQVVEKQKFIEGLLEKLGKIETEARTEVKPLVQAIIREIKGSNVSGINWEGLMQQFERTNPDLLKRIARRWPRLTQKDLQFCALTVTGLSTGEIAELLHVTTRSVETTRYRIRGKIGIDSKVELGTFLQAI